MEMILHHFEPREVLIKPLSDIQWIGPQGPTATRRLKEDIAEHNAKDGLYIGGGDYLDLMSPSNRAKYAAAGFYDTTLGVMERTGESLVKELYHEILAPTTNRWLGMVHGHHWFPFPEGDTSDTRLCQLLKTRYLGTSAYIGLNFKGMGIVNIWLHHGAGSCSNNTAQLGKLEKMAGGFDADVYVMAHYTRKPQSDIVRVYPRWQGNAPHLAHREKKLVGAGGYCKGWALGSKIGKNPMGSYVEQGCMTPGTLGSPTIKIVPRMVEKNKNGKRIRAFEPVIKVES